MSVQPRRSMKVRHPTPPTRPWRDGESGANQNRSASCAPERFRPTSGPISRRLAELLDALASYTVTFRVTARSIRPPMTAPTAIAA